MLTYADVCWRMLQVRRLDAAGLQAQGLAHLVELLGKSGKLRQVARTAMYARCRELIRMLTCADVC